ncbi:MAG: hypothetical protein IK073_05420 [Paludibacteraceae bacterium]|nr:hypothetical protein [Paludibacteraceae bacterium]MBR6018041.1 hypothetical protein [Paludibacteraceae bacterium]
MKKILFFVVTALVCSVAFTGCNLPSDLNDSEVTVRVKSLEGNMMPDVKVYCFDQIGDALKNPANAIDVKTTDANGVAQFIVDKKKYLFADEVTREFVTYFEDGTISAKALVKIPKNSTNTEVELLFGIETY